MPRRNESSKAAARLVFIISEDWVSRSGSPKDMISIGRLDWSLKLMKFVSVHMNILQSNLMDCRTANVSL